MFNNCFCFRNTFNLLERCKALFFSNIEGVNSVKRAVPIIISLSSKEPDFYELELTLYSLLNQVLLPDRIILWLSSEYSLNELPYGITKYVKNGLEIRFVKCTDDYTNVICAMKEFQGSIIVTSTAGIYYKNDWLKKLYHSYISNPDDIHAHNVIRIKYNKITESILPVKSWVIFEKDESARFDNLAITSGGVLYPPNCFNREIFRDDIYLTNSIDCDVWMWLMSLLSNRKIRLVKSHIRTLSCINLFKFIKKNLNKYRKYDAQINKLIPYYGQNIAVKIRK